ncbi:glucosyltransferase domain-containing protein [Enterobacter kobei]|uniref:glucosyltransferase domain-containing protein n=1 Tax=Enterobacter kobei TaxID=208224 RepID=UPI002379498A|nr:glucosyltransferase domain-containing protein [Enterobacter kobei]MDD9221590.1 glucosyltransferase domain-containing protein [Enterobacter kobei]
MKTQEEKKAIAISLLTTLIYSLPLILWGGLYIDDMARAIGGQTGWSVNGRPLADLTFNILNFFTINADSSPMPQLMACAIMSYVMFATWKRFIPSTGSYGVIFTSQIILSPLFLANLSFKYDAVTMALSVLFCVLPFTLKLRGKIFALIVNVSLIIASLSLYQASISVYIVYATLSFLVSKDKDVIIKLIKDALTLVFGYSMYSYFIASNYLTGEYNLKHSVVVSPVETNFLEVVKFNLLSFYKIIDFMFKGWYAATMSIMIIMFMLSISLIIINNIKARDFVRVVISTCAIPVMLLCCIGPVIFLKEPLFSPRVMIGFGAVILAITVVSVNSFPALKKSFFCIIFIQAFSCAMLSYTYANTLRYQHEYENNITTQLISDLYINELQDIDNFIINGVIVISPQGLISTQKYPIIRYLIPRLVVEDSSWGMTRFIHSGLRLRYASTEVRSKALKKMCSLKIIKKSNFYNIYKMDRTAIIDLKRDCK